MPQKLNSIKVEVANKQANKDTQEKSSVNENAAADAGLPKEVNGPRGLEPTRYGDWEAKGRCYDF